MQLRSSERNPIPDNAIPLTSTNPFFPSTVLGFDHEIQWQFGVPFDVPEGGVSVGNVVELGTIASDLDYFYAIFFADGSSDVGLGIVTIIPEPSTAALLLTYCIVPAMLRRRNKIESRRR